MRVDARAFRITRNYHNLRTVLFTQFLNSIELDFRVFYSESEFELGFLSKIKSARFYSCAPDIRPAHLSKDEPSWEPVLKLEHFFKKMVQKVECLQSS